MFFSSADYYDDPFDTYFYIKVDRMLSIYEKMKKDLSDENNEFINNLYKIAEFMGQQPNDFVNALTNTTLNFSDLKNKLMQVRSSVQRRLFSICFCEDAYNETLWIKYAKNYSGFVQIYDVNSPDTFLCGKFEGCKNCHAAKEKPYIYPVYYSDTRYDATKFALGVLMLDRIGVQKNDSLKDFYNLVRKSIIWEIERISLIKKKCHEYDKEWRMIRPQIYEQRSCIKMKPSKIIIGMRTPQYKRKLIISAAKIAGIQEIHELYIDDADELNSRSISN